MILPTKQELLDSLYSKTCPACGQRKREQQTFCGDCYHELPKRQQLALYRKFGRGYEQAVTDALNELDAEEFCKGVPQ